MNKLPRRVLIGLALLARIAAAFAVSPLQLPQFDHTTWTAHDGAPVNARNVLVQDRDGVLWVGGPEGLYSFDGAEFSPFVAPPSELQLSAGVRAMAASIDGSLWLGLELGGVAQVRDGHVAHLYGVKDGLPQATVFSIVVAPGKPVLAVIAERAYRLEGDRWSLLPMSGPIAGEAVRDLFVDDQGRLYVLTDNAVWRRRDEQAEFARVLSSGGWGGLFRGHDGSVWAYIVTLGNAPNTVRQIPTGAAPSGGFESLKGQFYQPIWGPDGALWLPTDKGIVRMRDWAGTAHRVMSKRDERLGRADGLTGDLVGAIFEDRAGSIWIATDRGIDRFRKPDLVRLPTKDTMVEAIVTACPSGTIWMSSFPGPPIRLGPYRTETMKAYPAFVTAMVCSDDESLWMATETGLVRATDGKLETIGLPADFQPLAIRQLIDGPGGMYASVNQSGLWRRASGQWSHVDIGMGTSPPIVMARGGDGVLWCGFADGRVIRHDGRSHEAYAAAEKNSLGAIEVFLVSRHGLLVGGVGGIGVIEREQVRALHVDDREGLRGVSGMLETADGDVWTNGLNGLMRFPAADISAAVASAGHALHGRRYIESDVAGPSAQILRVPTAVKRRDGILWFSTSNTVVSVDPAQLHPSTMPPTLTTVSLWVDEVQTASGGGVAPGYHGLKIHFRGVQLNAPERVTYKYRLDGLESDWRDGGNRPDAHYSALAPGRYVFHVMASNGDGVWTPDNHTLEFEVLPAFYQTKTFVAACVALTAFALFLAVSARIHKAEREIRRSAEERANERVRIARDLHDTLLQSMHGLMLRFHVAVQSLPAKSMARETMETALSRADELLTEGRDRVTGLRIDDRFLANLPLSIDAACRALNLDLRVQHEVAVTGDPVELKTHVAQELFLIAREALTNAYRHGRPTKVHVAIRYGSRWLELTISDDGVGFDAEPDAAAVTSRGSWGVTGMKERAAGLGAKLSMTSQQGRGTVLSLTVPAWRAYDRTHRVRAWTARWVGKLTPPFRRMD